MTFHVSSHFSGVLHPHELDMIQRVYSKVSAQPWFTKDPERQGEFGAFVFRMYTSGMGEETRLYELSLAAAKDKFQQEINPQTARSE